jgi:hypothetical protein
MDGDDVTSQGKQRRPPARTVLASGFDWHDFSFKCSSGEVEAFEEELFCIALTPYLKTTISSNIHQKITFSQKKGLVFVPLSSL